MDNKMPDTEKIKFAQTPYFSSRESKLNFRGAQEPEHAPDFSPRVLDKMNNKRGKKAQITIFIIIAIVIVAAVVLVFAFRDKLFAPNAPAEFSEVYSYYEDCVRQKTLTGLNIAGMQAGYIEQPEFEAGNDYAPFSSQLDFLGIGVPYWYYVSGNNIVKEQVPSLSTIEQQTEDYLTSEIAMCDFSDFRAQGYIINTKTPSVDVKIRNAKVDVSIKESIDVQKGEAKVVKSDYKISVESKFGKFYALAKEIYTKEKAEAFLENYGIDVMYNYAPVTGVEISCAPKIWNPREVVSNITQGLSANIAALKIKGDYYTLKNKKENYFVLNVKSDEIVNFMYDSNWPTKIEIWPVDGSMMIAEPVGLESGLGILGFCYVPYHFVYDIYYPVLIQIYDNDEIFQFPVAVVIDKSTARNALKGETETQNSEIEKLCSYRNTQVQVYTYDNELSPVEADISFVCLNQRCNIGKTEISGGDSVLSDKFPQCINGKVIAKAEGYVTEEQIVSTNEPTTVNIVMAKKYPLSLRLLVDNVEFKSGTNEDIAVVNFESEKNSFSVAYPQQNKIYLSEGEYNISVQVFSSSSLNIPASSSRQCVETPAPGLGGIFGSTEEQCFDIDMPAQIIDKGLIAGGKTSEYVLENELKGSTQFSINVNKLPNPNTLEQLQQNYELAEVNGLGVSIT